MTGKRTDTVAARHRQTVRHIQTETDGRTEGSTDKSRDSQTLRQAGRLASVNRGKTTTQKDRKAEKQAYMKDRKAVRIKRN